MDTPTAPTRPTEDQIAVAQAALDDARQRREVLNAAVRVAADNLHALLEAKCAATLAAHQPIEVWSDPALFAEVVTFAWSDGYGNLQASQFLKDAVAALDPDGFYDFDYQDISDPQTGTVHSSIRPQIKFGYRQDINLAADAIETMFVVLNQRNNNNGADFLIFEHTLAAHGRWMLRVQSPDRATLTCRDREEFTGTLRETLTRIADRHWYDGGNSDLDD